MAYNVEKLHKMEDALRTTACLVGDVQNECNPDGYKEGLGLANEALICTNAADAIKEGIFKTIVMGTFNNGKSTIINALIGERVLPEAATPATAIMSYIRKGSSKNIVYVYDVEGNVEEMSTSEFFERYKFSAADAEECKRTGKVERFSNIDYSIIYSDMQILENGVQILDSPGLEDKEVATKVTMKAASNANAIIYTGSVPNGGFNLNDQSFFKANFEGRHLNNVFFLINRADFFDGDALQEVKDYFKVQLKDVFSKEDGSFDESLFNKRVFFISAKYALEYKTGRHSDKYSERDLPEFERFEKELEEFLTTDERSVATFNSCFSKMANAYSAAIHTSELNKVALEKGVDEVRRDLEQAEQILDSSEQELNFLRKSFDIAISKTQSVVDRSLLGIIDNINDTWEVEMNRIVEASGFSELDLMKIAGQAVIYIANKEKRDAAFAEAVAPITDGVQRFFRQKVEDASVEIATLTKPIMKDLAQDIKQTQLKVDGNFAELYKIFTIGDGKVEKGNVNILKLLGATLNRDANVLIEVLAGNDMGWADFLKKTIVEMFVDTLLFSIIGGPIGFALFVIKEWWALRKGRNNMMQGLASKSKDELIRDLKKKIEEKSDELSASITNEYNAEFNRISKDIRAKINEERSLLNAAREKLNDAEYNYAAEIERCEYIIGHILEVSSNAYESIYGNVLTSEDLLKLSVKS